MLARLKYEQFTRFGGRVAAVEAVPLQQNDSLPAMQNERHTFPSGGFWSPDQARDSLNKYVSDRASLAPQQMVR